MLPLARSRRCISSGCRCAPAGYNRRGSAGESSMEQRLKLKKNGSFMQIRCVG